MDEKAIRRAALVTVRRATCQRFPPLRERRVCLRWLKTREGSGNLGSGPSDREQSKALYPRNSCAPQYLMSDSRMMLRQEPHTTLILHNSFAPATTKESRLP